MLTPYVIKHILIRVKKYGKENYFFLETCKSEYGVYRLLLEQNKIKEYNYIFGHIIESNKRIIESLSRIKQSMQCIEDAYNDIIECMN
jgi:hypothetical protein